MITSDKGKVAIVGKHVVICSELSMLISEMNKLFTENLGEGAAKREIMNAVETGFRPIEEIEKEVMDKKGELSDLLRMLADVLGEKESEEDGSDK